MKNPNLHNQKVTLRKRDKKAKIENIIEITRKMIEEKGFIATTTNHIAKAAGVSVGLIYKYFPMGKADIARKIATRYHLAIVETMETIDVTENDFEKRLRLMLNAWIKEHRENAQMVRAMEIAMLSNPLLFIGYSDFIRKMVSKGKLFLKIPKTNDSSALDLKGLTLALYYTIDGVINRHVTAFEIFDTDKELVDYLTELCIGMIERRLAKNKKTTRDTARGSTNIN